jgi:16S rRNA (cytidine1402-2'-O)-methyltransferase
MLDVLGDRTVALGRELTKAHEELAVRPISVHLAEIVEARGEFTLVVSPRTEPPAPPEIPSLQAIRAEFGELTENGRVSRREAVRTIAEKYGIRVKAAYDLVEAALK